MVAARTLTASTAATSPSSPTPAMMCAVSTARRAAGEASGVRARAAATGRERGRWIRRRHAATVASAAPAVVGRDGEPRLVRADRLARESRPRGGGRAHRRGRGRRRSPALRWSVCPARLLVVAAAALTVTGELEVLLGSAGETGRLVSALAVPAMTLPLAWSRRSTAAGARGGRARPADPGGAGRVPRRLRGDHDRRARARALLRGPLRAGHGSSAASRPPPRRSSPTRVAFDPAAQTPREALLTFAAVAGPLLVGRWARGQGLLQRELADKARPASARPRARRAPRRRGGARADRRRPPGRGRRRPTDDRRPRRAPAGELRAGDHHAARERLAPIAGTARAALGDVRRVLGVLRHDGEPPRLAPPRRDALWRRRPGDALAGAAPHPLARRDASGAERLTRRRCSPRRCSSSPRPSSRSPARRGAPLTAVAIAAPLLWRRRRPVAVAAAVLRGDRASRARCSTSTRSRSATSSRWSSRRYAIGAYARRRARGPAGWR